MQSAPALRPNVLVVEDEANIRELVCLHLGLEEVASEQAATATRASSWRGRRSSTSSSSI